jgi:alpha-1,4-galacturonosyltransferase
MQDVSKKKTSGSNGIPVEKSTRSKSKAKLKGTFSLVELNNDTFVSKGKHLERTNSKSLLVVLLEKHNTSIHLTVSSGVSGPHMLKRYQRKDMSGRLKVTNNLFIYLHFLVLK